MSKYEPEKWENTAIVLVIWTIVLMGFALWMARWGYHYGI